MVDISYYYPLLYNAGSGEIVKHNKQSKLYNNEKSQFMPFIGDNQNNVIMLYFVITFSFF